MLTKLKRKEYSVFIAIDIIQKAMEKFNPHKLKYLKIVNKCLGMLYHAPKHNLKLDIAQIKNIAIVDFMGIGDTVMLIPMLKVIKKNIPEASVTLIGSAYEKTILNEQGLVDHFVTFDGCRLLENPIKIFKNLNSMWKTIKKINEKSYELSIETRGDLRYIFFMHFIKSKRKAAFTSTGGEYFLTDALTPLPKTVHLIDEKLYLLKCIGFQVDGEDVCPNLKLSLKDLDFLDQYKARNKIDKLKRITGIHPSASLKSKEWKGYPKLLERLHREEPDTQLFLIFEGPREEETVNELKKAADRAGADYRVVREKLPQYVRIISLCNRMICNDSGSGHLAAAYGVPVVVIYGPVNPELALPHGKNKVIPVSHHLKCKPCSQRTCFLKTNECIASISVEEVYDAVKNLKEEHRNE